MKKRLQRMLILVVWLAVAVTGIGAETATQVRIVPLIDITGVRQYLAHLESAIPAARVSIDILSSNGELTDDSLWDKIVAAAGRGVAVRVILDASDWSESITAKNLPTIEFLKSHGIAAKFDDPTVTTHAKLVVIDGRLVILGSSNWNTHAFHDQAQANIAIDDSRIGGVFTEYFSRIWAGTLIPGGVDMGTMEISAYPTLIPIPDGPETKNYTRVLLDLLNRAQVSVYVVMYRASYYPAYKDSLSNDILNALIAAAGRGVEVKVFLDDCAFYPESAKANQEAAYYLVDHGVAVRFDDPSVTTHAKLVIIDGRDVILGSTNWNYYSLEKNNEADIAVVGIPKLAAAYTQFFAFLWRRGRPVR